jgi:RNA polymerase sigma factor FliA
VCDEHLQDAAARFHSAFDLVEYNARQTARRLRCGDVTLDDLRSLASEGLLRASRSFDPSRGTPFRRWANRRIRDWLAEGLRQWAHLPRYRLADRASSRDELIAGCLAMAVDGETTQVAGRQAPDPEQSACARELAERLRQALVRLPCSERALIERHDLAGESLHEVARTLGISKSWATRLRVRAIARLARALREDGARRGR